MRLDGQRPGTRSLRSRRPLGFSARQVALLLRGAVTGTSFVTDPHPYRPGGWRIEWGDQVEPRPAWVTGWNTEVTTAARDRSVLRTHVLPQWGPWQLAKINHLSIQKWVPS